MLKQFVNFFLLCMVSCVQVRAMLDYREKIPELLEKIDKLDSIPTSFVFKTCWNTDENLKTMEKLKNPIAFLTNDFLEIQRLKGQEAMIVLDLNCTGNLDFLKQVNETYFKFPFRWTLLRKISNIDPTIDTINAYPDSNIILATWNNDDSFLLQQSIPTYICCLTRNQKHTFPVYRTGPLSREMLYENYGQWTESNSLIDIRSTPIVSMRRRNLQGYPLTTSIVILDNSSLNHLLDYKDKTTDPVTKSTFAPVYYMMDHLNCTKQFLYSDTWGYYNPETKKINGLFGHILDKVADFTGTSIFIIPERIPLVDYLHTVIRTRPSVLFRPPPLSFLTNIYYLPFEPNVWTGCIILVAISCVVIYVTFKASNARFSIYFVSEQIRLSDIMLFAVAAISQMGSSIEPKYFSGRISATFFFISLLFLYTAYTANIVSLLQATTKNIKTLEDLYKSQMKFVIQDTVYSRNYFPNFTDEVRKGIYEKKIVPNLPHSFTNMSHGIKLLRQGYYAFHCEIGTGFKYIEDTWFEHEKCAISEIPLLQGIVDPWIAVQKHSPYNEMAKITIFRIREHGIQLRENAKIYTKKPQCSGSGQSFESVRLMDCYILILILLYGFLLAVLVFLLEKIMYSKFRSTKICLY